MTRAFFYLNLFSNIALNLTMPILDMTPVTALDPRNHEGSPLMTNPDSLIHVTHLDHAAMVPPRLGEGGRDGLIKAGFSRDEINHLATSGAAIFNDAEDR
jgi:hypothetical protein